MGLISAEAWRGCRGALAGQEEAVAAEVQLMQKVIAVMVGREGSLVEMRAPEQLEGEDTGQFQVRRARQRVLIVNPNYHLEEP
jgi:MCM6 C-terminal winged-helix domain